MNFKTLGIDPAQWTGLESLIEKTPGLRELLRSSEETPMDRALRCVSLVRLFDEPLYTGVFRAEDAALPPFEDVIRNPDVEPVPRTQAKYWLRGDAQRRRQAAWLDDRDDERVWCGRLYRWLAANGGSLTDLLDLLLRSDTSGALSMLEREYNRADTANDMVLCHALAEQVQAGLNYIPVELKDAFLQFVTRYRARALFLPELHRTAKYFPRPAVEKAFDEMVAGDGDKWILFLDAAGGMGKTTFVQRMIAHKLLKSSPFPLVVRVDLDDLNVSSLAAAPWLIAIEIAHALEQQVSSKLFSTGTPSFLDQVEPFRALLYRRTSDRARSLSDEAVEQLRTHARSEFYQWSKFQSYCAELPRERPLIIFIDTIEEASLHFSDKFRKVLENFQVLRRDMPQLRLVLSGRYRPDSTNFPEYDQNLRDETLFVRLEPLKPDDSRDFIRELLSNRLATDLLEAMVESANGNPFKLALLCEIVANRPSMSGPDLKDCKDADVAYLIYRVIDRIPADKELGLRWLLRYGAVPRRLTFSFVTTTLHPLLLRALRGELEAQNEDIPSEAERKAWLKRADVDLDPKNLWEKLTKYSSEHGWISVDTKDSNTVTLHSEVVKPMRRLLKDQRAQGRTIYTTLNTEAANHFAQLKREHPERWVDYTLGEMFHLIEAEMSDPLQATKNAFAERPSFADGGLRLELAREIVKTDGDFSDAPPAVRAWANYEAADAIAIVGNFRYLPADERRQEISRHLAYACDLARNTRLKLPAIVWRWREFLDSNYPDTRNAIFGLLGFRSEDRSRYWLLLIDLFGQERLERRALSLLRFLITVFEGSIDSPRIPKWVWKERYAASLTQIGRYDSAVSMLRDLLTPSPSKCVQDTDRMRSRLIKALILGLRLNEAERELEKYPQDTTLADNNLSFAAEIHLLRRNAWAALECAGRFRNPSDYRAGLIRGIAFGQLLRIADASGAFAEALAAAKTLGQQHTVNRVQLGQMRFRLLEAELTVETMPARSVGTGGDAALIETELELCRAYQLRSSNPTAASACVLALTAETYATLIRARAMLAAFSWGMLPEGSIVTMRKVLGNIDSYNSRLYLTAPPVEFRNQLDVGSSRTDMELLMAPISDDSGAHLAYLYGARFLRAIGREKKAESMFRKCKISDPPSREELAMLRQFRMGGTVAEPAHTWDALRDEPGLYMAAMVENAERALAAGDGDLARDSLTRVARVPELELLLPGFAKRRLALEASLGVRSEPKTPAVALPPQPSATILDFRCLLLGTEGERLFALQPGQNQPALISTVESEALAVLTMYSQERTPQRLVECLVKQWQPTVSDLTVPFVEMGLVSIAAAPLLLVLTTPQLVAAPWELALAGSPGWVIRIGSGREDGPVPQAVRSSLDASGVARLVSKANGPFGESPSVAVFTPTTNAVFNASNIAKLLGSTATQSIRRADIIYIATSVYPDPHGEPSLAPGLTADYLCNQIASQPGSQRPFVILYTPSEGSLSQAVEQLLVRNQFAQALVNSGVISGVLATGLDDPRRLMDAVAGAPALFDVPRRLMGQSWRMHTDQPLDMLATVGSAMFVAIDPPSV